MPNPSISLQGALLKAINIAWTDFSADIKRNRKWYQPVDKYTAIPNVLESFRVNVEEEPNQWRINFFPTEPIVRSFHREFERQNPNTGTNALNVYEVTIVVRKADFRILKRIAAR